MMFLARPSSSLFVWISIISLFFVLDYSVSAFHLSPSTTRMQLSPPLQASKRATTKPSILRSSYHEEDSIQTSFSSSNQPNQRRSLLHKALLTATTAVSTSIVLDSTAPQPAFASGGATAGRYTTIPIAKRRYYGRVQQGVHEFIGMGKDMVGLDMTAGNIQHFFDVQGTVIIAAKRSDVNGQCTKKDGDCRGKEIRDSRWNDMKASMYLLANAFRTDQQKPPDRLPTVKAARAFFEKVNGIEKAVAVKKPKTKDPATVQLYADALDILDAYLDLVELPPIDSGHYEQEFDTLVGESARIT